MKHLTSLVLVVTLLSGCAAWTATKSLFVSAVSLEVVGEQFLQTTKQVQAGCDSRAIPIPTCQRYKIFHDRFQKAYPIAVGMWRAADKANDASTKGKAEDVVRSLSKDLADLTAEALGAFVPEVR